MGERAAPALLQAVAALPRNGLPPVADDPPPQPHVGGPTALHAHPRAANAEPHPGPPNESPSSSTSHFSSSSSSTPGEADHQPRPDAPSHGHDPGADARLSYRASLANLDPFVAQDILAQPCRRFRVHSPRQFCNGVLRSSLRLDLELIRSCARAPAGQIWSRPGNSETLVLLSTHVLAQANHWCPYSKNCSCQVPGVLPG